MLAHARRAEGGRDVRKLHRGCIEALLEDPPDASHLRVRPEHAVVRLDPVLSEDGCRVADLDRAVHAGVPGRDGRGTAEELVDDGGRLGRCTLRDP
jgi:hypothetical protein